MIWKRQSGCKAAPWRNLQKSRADSKEVNSPLLAIRAVPRHVVDCQSSCDLFCIHVLHLGLGKALVHPGTRLDTAIAHELVENLRVHLVHASLLLKSLDSNLDALDESLVWIIHLVFFLSFLGLDGWLHVVVFEACGFAHVLGRAFRVGFLLLLVQWNWIHGRLIVASTRVKSDIVALLAKVLVEQRLALKRYLALDRLAISGDLQESTFAESGNYERFGFVGAHLLEAAYATDRHRNVLAPTALLQEVKVCRQVLIREVEFDLLISVHCI